jgi:hypothetical protein
MSSGSAQESDRPAGDDGTRYHELRDIFVAATNAEGFTETQDRRATSRRLADEESASVSEAVADIVRDDGLGDTYADPVYKSDGE